MSEVRRDHKGRKLLMGESQRKDGKYEYKYQDARGKRKTVYSWRLTPSDRMPAGKRNDISLREKEKQIQKDLNSNIIPDGGDYTVLDLVEKYIRTKTGVRHNTKANYTNSIVSLLYKDKTDGIIRFYNGFYTNDNGTIKKIEVSKESESYKENDAQRILAEDLLRGKKYFHASINK